jgi:hypothetical protein
VEQLVGDAIRALWRWGTTPLRTLLADALAEALARRGGEHEILADDDSEVLRWGPTDVLDSRPPECPPPSWLIYTDHAKRPE